MADKTNDDAEALRGAMLPPQPVEYLNHEDLERHRRLIKIEPQLTRMVSREEAWALVTETIKKIAGWLTGVAAGLFVLREILRSVGG